MSSDATIRSFLPRYPLECYMHGYAVAARVSLWRSCDYFWSWLISNYSEDMTRRNHKHNNLSLGEVPRFSGEREVGWKRRLFRQENRKHLCAHSLSIGDIFNDVTWPLSEFTVISSRRFQLLFVSRWPTFCRTTFLRSTCRSCTIIAAWKGDRPRIKLAACLNWLRSGRLPTTICGGVSFHTHPPSFIICSTFRPGKLPPLLLVVSSRHIDTRLTAFSRTTQPG